MDNQFIYPIRDIDNLILLKFNKVSDLFQLSQVNKYYHNYVSDLPLIQEIKEYNSKKDDCTYSEILHDNLFIKVCGHGFINYAKYLFKNYKIDIHANYDYAFRWSCAKGHLDVAKWLSDLGKELNSPINIHVENDNAFRYSCQFGFSEVAKWLFNLSIQINSPINIHENDDYAFRWSCINGHLEVAKWLFNLSIQINSPIDIHSRNDFTFRYSKNEYLELYEWLCTID